VTEADDAVDESRNPDTLPTSRDPSGKCPRCGRVASFDRVRNDQLNTARVGNTSGPTEYAVVLRCQGCQDSIVVVEVKDAPGHGTPTHGVMWWPQDHLGDLERVAGVPLDIITSYSEGVRCLAVEAPNAAAAMFRNTIAQIVHSRGSDAAKKKHTLEQAIDQIEEDKTMWEGFGGWAHHVRITGNAGAHGEKFDPVTMEQATDLKDFVREIINFAYEQPARRQRATPVTKKATTPQ
jgi:hypothetical protein